MSVKTEGKKNLFVVGTIGEDYTFETLDTIKAKTAIPYALKIYYGVKDKIDLEKYNRFLTYTDDVTVYNAKHNWGSAWGSELIYGDYDYLWIFNADSKPLDGYIEKVDLAFQLVPYTVCVGSPKWEGPFEIAISALTTLPDTLLIFDRTYINMVGSVCPAFRFHGHDNYELMQRVLFHRFNFVGVRGLVNEIGPTNPANPGFGSQTKPGVETNWDVMKKANEMLMQNRPYPWWSDKIMEMN